jgi:hypothetical protein
MKCFLKPLAAAASLDRGDVEKRTLVGDAEMFAFDSGCVKTLRSITAPGILGSTVTRRAKNAKICLPLGITTKSDFVFTRPR